MLSYHKEWLTFYCVESEMRSYHQITKNNLLPVMKNERDEILLSHSKDWLTSYYAEWKSDEIVLSYHKKWLTLYCVEWKRWDHIITLQRITHILLCRMKDIRLYYHITKNDLLSVVKNEKYEIMLSYFKEQLTSCHTTWKKWDHVIISQRITYYLLCRMKEMWSCQNITKNDSQAIVQNGRDKVMSSYHKEWLTIY